MTAARKTDPISSHLAAIEVEVSGTKRRQQIAALTILRRFEKAKGAGGTRSELAHHQAIHEWDEYRDDATAHAALVRGEIQILKAMLGRRLPELSANGLVHVSEIRRCDIAGRASQVWQLTPIGAAAADAYLEAKEGTQ